MTRNAKPAARDAAGPRIVLSWAAKHFPNSAVLRSDQAAPSRLAYLRTLADIVSVGASEAPSRESRERLHAATAAIFDALAIERRALACERAAPCTLAPAFPRDPPARSASTGGVDATQETLEIGAQIKVER